MNSPNARKKSKSVKTLAVPPNVENMVLRPELTIYAAQDLKDELLGAVARNGVIELDLSQVVEIDSAGLQVLMLALRESCSQGKTLRLTSCSPAVQELIQLYNLDGQFGIPAPGVHP